MSKFRQIFIFIIFMILVSALPAFAEKKCFEETVCIITEDKDTGVDFYLENIKTYDLTITFGFSELKNLKVDKEIPYIFSVKGKNKVKVLTISKIDTNEAWKYYYDFYWISGSMYAKHDNNYIYDLPFASGETFRVIQGFNGKFSHFGDNKYATDWDMPEGTPVHAAREGIVAGIQDQFNISGIDSKIHAKYANFVIIKHSDGTFGEYDHLKKYGVEVKAGQRVNKGDLLGYSGNTGFSSGPHLHFFVYKAINGTLRKSFPIRFNTTKGILYPDEGEEYTAP